MRLSILTLLPSPQLKGADPQGLTRLALKHAGPNPPIAPLPEAAEAAKVAGNAFFKDGKYGEAIERYSEAISLAVRCSPVFPFAQLLISPSFDLQPTAFSLYGNRSLSYLKSTPPSSSLALADAQKATELAPKWGKGWVRLGEALSAESKGEESVKAFEKAVETSDGLVKTGEFFQRRETGGKDADAIIVGSQRRSKSSTRRRRSWVGIEAMRTRRRALRSTKCPFRRIHPSLLAPEPESYWQTCIPIHLDVLNHGSNQAS